MANLEGTRNGSAPVSKPVAIACALIIAGLAFVGGWILRGAGERWPADVELVGWVEPLDAEASDVARDVAAADRILRLYILQGKKEDADRFLVQRETVDKSLARMKTIATAADPKTATAADEFGKAVTTWLGVADDTFKAAKAETIDSVRATVMARMGPDDSLVDLTGANSKLEGAIKDARNAKLAEIRGTEDRLIMRLLLGFALLAVASVIALLLAILATRQVSPSSRTVDIGLLRSVLDQLPDPVAIFGPDGRIMVSNLGASRSVVSMDGGPTHLALYRADGEPVADQDSPLVRALMGQHVHEREYFAERLDGSLAPVEVHAEPILDNGVATAAVVVMRDCGEEQRHMAEVSALAEAKSSAEASAGEVARRLRQVEGELAEAHAATGQLEHAVQTARHEAETRIDRFETLANSGGAIGVALFGVEEMRLLDVNESALEMLGERRRARDVRGSTLSEIVPGAETSGLMELFQKVATNGETYSSDEYHVEGLRTGSAYWRFALVPLVPEGGGAATELALLGVDVTAEVERREAEASRGPAAGEWTIEDVLLAISNDLRTPILSIQGMVGLFRQKYAEAVPDVTALHYLELTQRNADQIATLIDDLVALSSLGHADRKPAEIPLAAAIEEAWRASPRTGVELRVAGPLPTVRADRAQLMRAFRDVFDTASRRRRAGEGAWMHVRVRDLGQQWEIELSDNGQGVESEEDGERLFGPLARHLVSVPHNGGPTLVAGGLGLAAVRRIAELHGGTANVAASQGEGTTYSFTIDK